MYRWSTKPPEKISNESGMTLVITLFLLLSLLMMASGITFVANNQEKEEAIESLEAQTQGEELKIGVNAGYLIDVINFLLNAFDRC